MVGSSSVLCTSLSHDLEVAPDVIGHHDDLKVCIVVLKPGRGDGRKPLAFCLPDQVLHVGPLVILLDDLVDICLKIGAKDTLCIPILFKQFLLRGKRLLFRDAHGDKPTLLFPPHWLIYTTIVLVGLSLPRFVPTA